MPIGAHPRASKRRWPLAEAEAVASDLVTALRPACVRVCVAGSIRRRQLMVGDIELVFVPEVIERRDGLFDTEHVPLTDAVLEDLLTSGTLAKRRKANGTLTWGEQIKLAEHVATGIPVDLFATTVTCWWNYLTCRTGPKESNVRVATAAQKRGLKWTPFGQGFTTRSGRVLPVRSEAEVFNLVGLPCRPPEQR